jgi:hypothetical protein
MCILHAVTHVLHVVTHVLHVVTHIFYMLLLLYLQHVVTTPIHKPFCIMICLPKLLLVSTLIIPVL